MTLCFVLCRFDFLLLYVEFSVLWIMLHILNGAMHETEPRWRSNEERKGEYKYFDASVVMLVFIYLKSMQPVTITVKKSTGGFRFDYATYSDAIYWVLTVKVVT